RRSGARLTVGLRSCRVTPEVIVNNCDVEFAGVHVKHCGDGCGDLRRIEVTIGFDQDATNAIEVDQAGSLLWVDEELDTCGFALVRLSEDRNDGDHTHQHGTGCVLSMLCSGDELCAGHAAPPPKSTICSAMYASRSSTAYSARPPTIA